MEQSVDSRDDADVGNIRSLEATFFKNDAPVTIWLCLCVEPYGAKQSHCQSYNMVVPISLKSLAKIAHDPVIRMLNNIDRIFSLGGMDSKDDPAGQKHRTVEDNDI